MTALIVLFLVMAVVLAVLGCMDQRKVYWRTRAWRYRNPEANEPSDTALSLSRVGYFIAAVALLACAGIVHAADGSRTYSTEKLNAIAYAVASDLDEGTTSGLQGSYDLTSKVYDAVNDEGHGNVKIRDAGTDSYELTNRDGKNPVCLTVKADPNLHLGADAPWTTTVTTNVKNGPC